MVSGVLVAIAVVPLVGKPVQFASTSDVTVAAVTVSWICAPSEAGVESTSELSYIARLPAELPVLLTVRHVVPVDAWLEVRAAERRGRRRSVGAGAAVVRQYQVARGPRVVVVGRRRGEGGVAALPHEETGGQQAGGRGGCTDDAAPAVRLLGH